MNSDENVQKAIEASKEFQQVHPEVPTVDVEAPNRELKEPYRNDFRRAAFSPAECSAANVQPEAAEAKARWTKEDHARREAARNDHYQRYAETPPDPPLVRVTRELNELRDAAQAFLKKMAKIEASDRYRSVWEIAYLHGLKYDGPTWEDEREHLRTVLETKV